MATTTVRFSTKDICPECKRKFGFSQMLYLDETHRVLRCPTHPYYSKSKVDYSALETYENIDGQLIKPYVPTVPGGGTGPQGPKGEKGDKGDQGIQGVKGDTGATGPVGKDGAAGAKGDTGAVGPKGDTGDKGDAGKSVSSLVFTKDVDGKIISGKVTFSDATTADVSVTEAAAE